MSKAVGTRAALSSGLLAFVGERGDAGKRARSAMRQ